MTWTSIPPLDPKLFITGEQLGQLYQSFIKDYPGEHWDETERAPGGTLMELGGTGKALGSRGVTLRRTVRHCMALG